MYRYSARMNEIRRYRQRLGWSQQDLVDAIERTCGERTSVPQISRLEKGQRSLDQQWLTKLSRALNVPMTALLGETTVPKDTPVMIPVKGRLDGYGALHPLKDSDLDRVNAPEGETEIALLSCYIMDDDSMADTLAKDSYFVARDLHTGGEKILPGYEYLVMHNGRCHIRQLYADATGKLWFMAAPREPAPYPTFPANIAGAGAVYHSDPAALRAKDILARVVYDARMRRQPDDSTQA